MARGEWSVRRWAPLALAVLLGTGASLAAFALIQYVERAGVQAAFQQVADEGIDQLQENAREILTDVRAVHGLFASSEYVTRSEFETFVLPVLAEEPALRAIFWAPRIEDARRSSFELSAQEEGLTGFAVRDWGAAEGAQPRAPQKHYYPIYYIAPGRLFSEQLGWDLLSDPVRAQAVTAAINSTRLAASEPVSLSPQESRYGLVLLQAVYGAASNTGAQTLSPVAVAGVIGALLDPSRMATRRQSAVVSRDVELVLRDPAASEGGVVLWSTLAQREVSDVLAASEEDESGLLVSRAMSLADRRLEVVAVPTPAFVEENRSWVSWLVLSLGLLGTVLFVSYAVFLQNRAVAARTHAREMRLVLDRLREEMDGRARAEERLRQSQKMEAIGRLAGGIAHDFNNLLQVILGNAELLLAQGASGRSEGASDHVGEIKKAAELAAGLTYKLLAFARRQPSEPRLLRLDQEVLNMKPLLCRLAGDHIRVSFRGPESDGACMTARGESARGGESKGEYSSVMVRMDLSQLQQVVLNLAVNAIEAMPQGGDVGLAVLPVTIDDSAVQAHPALAPGRYAVLEVSDTGRGMDKETISKMFEPFFSTKETGRGTGLGLSTVYGIVKQYEGHIEVTSKQGEGTVFRVYLPRVDEEAIPEAVVDAPLEGERPMQQTSSAAGVLVVEDNDPVRRLAVRVLSAAGYMVWETAQPEEAVRLVEQGLAQPDLLLTDLTMPGMSGQALASRLLGLRPGLRVLYMSGFASDMVEEDLLDVPAAFLQKPFSASDLLDQVNASLEAN